MLLSPLYIYQFTNFSMIGLRKHQRERSMLYFLISGFYKSDKHLILLFVIIGAVVAKVCLSNRFCLKKEQS